MKKQIDYRKVPFVKGIYSIVCEKTLIECLFNGQVMRQGKRTAKSALLYIGCILIDFISCKKTVNARKIALISAVLLSFNVAQGANRYSVASGNWNSTSTWSASSGGGSGASVPVAGDVVYIERGYTVTVTSAAACSSVTFTGTGASAALTVNSGITLTTGAVTLNSLASASASALISGLGTLSCSSLAIGATNPTPSGGTNTTILTTSIAAINVTGNLSLASYRSAGGNYNNPSFIQNSGIVTVNGSVATSNSNASNVSTIILGNSSPTLVLSGATPFSLSGTGTNTLTLNGTGATVNYNNSGAQTIQGVTYNNLILSTSGTKTLGAATTVNGVLTVKAGTILALSNRNLSAPTSIVLECGATTGASITGTGILTLGGDVSVVDVGTGTNGASISAPVALGATRTFTVDDDGSAATDLTISSVISGGAGLIKAGVGTMSLSGASTYTGATSIFAGILKLGSTGGATNTPLGTIGGATTVALGATLDLNGFTLGTAEQLTLNGTGVSSIGALTNSSATAVTYNGVITLASASSVGTTGNITLGAGITGGQDLTKLGAGSLLLGTTTSTLNSLIISSGSLTSTSGTLNLAGDFTNNATFTHNGGTVVLNGTGSQVISGSVLTFNNLTVSNSSAAIQVNSNATIAGTLTMNGANTLLTPAASVIISGTGTLTGTGTVQVTRTAATADFLSQYAITNKTLTNLTVEYASLIGGQSINALSYSGLKFDNTSGTNTAAGIITVNGLCSSAVGGTLNTAYSINFNGTTTCGGSINATAGTVTYSSTALNILAGNYYNLSNTSASALCGDVSISNALAMGGIISTGNNNLTFSGTISGTSSTVYVNTNGTGSLKRQGTAASDFIMTYPVGSGGVYSPMQILNLSVSGITAPATVGVNARNVAASDIVGTTPLNRYWVTSTSNFSGSVLANVSFTYAAADVPSGQSASSYDLLYQPVSTGAWAVPGGVCATGVNPLIATSSNTIDANWSATISSKKSFYSLRSGDWDDPNTWTLDASGSQPNNPNSLTPTTSGTNTFDDVYVLSGRIVTVKTNNKANAKLEVTGQLDFGTSTGNSFVTINGTGRIRLAGDNFPTGDATDFITQGQGEGTVEYYGAARPLSTSRSFYHVDINMDASANVLTLLSDYSIAGNLNIVKGILSLNNASATTGLNVTVQGDVSVSAGAKILTGKGNARHQFNFYGNFTNNGEVQFSNRLSAVYNAEATDGITDANFLNANSDQNVLCNGITNFYRIEIDKGTDATYILNIDAGNSSYFNLFGYANEDHAAISQLVSNNNALGLVHGTVRIGNDVNISTLSIANNYNVSAGAQLWIDNGSVAKNTGSALVPYGKIKVSNGTLDVKIPSGITFRDNGIIYINGGTVNTNQIRTSEVGASNAGSYVQTSGVVNVLGGTTNASYYSFCLTYPQCVFNMSGGTLHVIPSTNGKGSIFINSDPANVQVTGGTVVCETNSTNANDFIITSRAAFWNLEMRNTSVSARNFILDAGTSIGGPTVTNLAIQPLTVLNDFKIWGTESGGSSYPAITFKAGTSTTNLADVYVGGSFTIENGAQYVAVYGGTSPYNTVATQPTAKNTTYFNQTTGTTGTETFYWGNTANELELGNIILNRNHGNVLSVISAAARSSESIIMDINGNATVTSGTLDQGRFTIRTWGNITNNDRMGTWVAGTTPSHAQIQFANQAFTITTAAGSVFGNVQFNVSAATNITLTSDVYIERMEYLQGLIYLKGYNLKVDNLWNMSTNLFENSSANSYLKVANSGASGNTMIFTDGKASDAGLTLKIAANSNVENQPNILNNTGPLTFPIGFTSDGGTTLYFRPAQMVVKNYSGSGYVAIRTVSGALQTTKQAGGEVLQHYWRVSPSGFTTAPTVAYRFYYRNQNVGTIADLVAAAANEASYVPGKVLDASPYTRSYDVLTDADIIKNIGATNTRAIIFNGTSVNGTFSPSSAGFVLDNANYTAGVAGRFTGSVLIYYTRDYQQQATWTDGNTWTRSDILNIAYANHDSRQPAAGTYPGVGDVAVIGWVPWTDANRATLLGQPHGVWISSYSQSVAEVVFTKMTDASGNPVPRKYRSNFQFRPTLCIDQPTGQLSAKLVKGEGLFWNRQSDPDYTLMDIGDFAREDSSYVIYENFSNNRQINNTPALFPNLYISNDNWGSNDINFTFTKDITTTGNVELLGDVNLILPTGATGNITVGRNLVMFENGGSGGGCEIAYGNTGTPRKITVGRDLIMNNTNSIIHVGTPGTTPLEHQLSVAGNITVGSSTLVSQGLQLWTAATQDRVTLYLTGNSNMSYLSLNNANSISNFYRIIVNKGNSQATTALFSSDFILNGPTAGVGIAKALQLNSGTFINNNPNAARILSLTTGNDNFSIPSIAGLELRVGKAVASGNSGISLDGLLNISGGNLDMSGGDNFIEYSSSDNANLTISSGALTVGSQIRRSLSSSVGVLNYTQTGGTVIVGQNSAPQSSRGLFEVLNAGSSFTMSAGDLYIVRQQASPTISALYLDPSTISVSNSALIHIGGATTPANQTIGIYSSKPLPKLRVDNSSGNKPIAQLQVIPATISSLLTIDAGASFDANGLDLNLLGDFTNNGTFIPKGNTTFFSGSSNQTLTGNTTFYNFTKNTSNNLLLATSNAQLTILNFLALQAGTFTDNKNNVYVKGDCQNDALHVYGGTGDGIILNGITSQILTGNGTFGKFTLNNSNGVNVPVGNHLTISNSLKMQGGIFNIGKNLLDLGVNAVVEQAVPFGITNMIETNISFTDNGVRKTFPVGATPTFIYPMGSIGKYTPITLAITANGNSLGSITAKPANEIHPSIIEDTETGTQIVDNQNALQYYWTLKSSGIAAFSGTATVKCIGSDVLVTSPYTSADYVTARLLSDGTGHWNKYSKADFDETANNLKFSFSGADDTGISGDYTAGAVDNSLNGAIPDNVAIYETNQSGNWHTGTIWTPNVSGGPRGSIAIIHDGHTVDVTDNNLSGYTTQIDGTLNLYSTNGHRLGIINGTGLMYLEQGDLPAGVYDNFFSSSGGTVEFGGTTDYDVLGNVMTLNKLVFSGTSNRQLPNNDVLLYGDMTIGGDAGLSVINVHNRALILQGNLYQTGGVFDAGTGTGAYVSFAGPLAQQIQGTFTGNNAFNILKINNTLGLSLLNNVEVTNQLVLNSGLINPGSNVLRIKYNATVSPVKGSSNSFVNGTLTKELMNSGSFTFPVGDNGSNLGTIGIASVGGTSGIQDWKATYHYTNPTVAGFNANNFVSPVNMVSKTEYWEMQAPVNGTSTITLYLDGSSDVASAASNLANLRVVGWNSSTSKWEIVGSSATVVGSAVSGSVTTTASVNYNNYRYFTIASISPIVSGTATITSGNVSICSGSSTDIIVGLTGTAPWVLTYNAGSTPVTSASISSSPFKITVSPSSTTTYTLTSVTANGIAGSLVGTISVTVTVSPAPTVVLNASTSTICSGSPVVFTGTTGFTSYNFRVNGVSKQLGSSNTFSSTSLPTGTPSIDLVAINSGGCSTTSSSLVTTVNTLPTAAGAITGSPSVCKSTSATYSIPAIANATSYSWAYSGTNATIANGTTNSITVTYTATATSGNLTVYGINSCGNSTTSTLAITVSNGATVSNAGTISGTNAVCQGASTVNYAVTAVTNATAYTWFYSGTGVTEHSTGNVIDNTTGVTIASPGTISIDFSPTATSGNLTVKGTSGCNTGPASVVYAVTVNPTPMASISPVSPATCASSSVTLTATPAGGTPSYSHAWTGAGASSLSNTGIANPSFSNTASGSYDVTYTVTDNKGCKGTALTSVMVYEAPVAVAGADIASCSGTSAIMMNGASASGSYTGTPTWSGSGGTWIQNPDPSLATFTPTATSGSVLATLTLSGANGCSTTAATRTITWGTLPVANAGTNISSCTGTSAIAMTGASATGSFSTNTWSGGAALGSWVQNFDPSLATFTPTVTSGSFTATLTLTGSSSCGDVTATRTVSWNTPASISVSPVSASACAGINYTFNVTASGTSLNYQWQRDGVNISGATSSSYTLSPVVKATDEAFYRVVVTAACGSSVTSMAALLTVLTSPVVTTQPGSIFVCANDGTVTFTVAASGNVTAFQWEEYDGVSWNVLSNNATYLNTTTANLSVVDPAYSFNGRKYRCLVSGDCTPVYSNGNAVLTVYRHPAPGPIYRISNF